jgi:hypothetical protein
VRGRLVVALVLALAAAGAARAAEWGTIEPATSTMESVRARYGGPTRTAVQKVEGYDTSTWIYEGAQAPAGLIRMVVEFGLLQAGGYRRELVRSFRLEPKRGIFDRRMVLTGWGAPDRAGVQNGVDTFVYAEGLVVIFAKDGVQAESMVFTPPQPLDPAPPSR